MIEFSRENSDNNPNNSGYDLTADFDQMDRYLSDISDGNTFAGCIEDIIGNHLDETAIQNQEPFVASSLELDLSDGRIAHVSRFGMREPALPTAVLLDINNSSYERYTLGGDGILVKHASAKQSEEFDEGGSYQEQRDHYLKIIKGEPLEEGEANALMGLLRGGRPRSK